MYDEYHRFRIHCLEGFEREWLLAERPDLAELTLDLETGRTLPSHSLNIFHPTVKARLFDAFRDLAAYDIDGILFQDDLVLRTGEGFSPEAIAAYMEDGGVSSAPEQFFRKVQEAEAPRISIRSAGGGGWGPPGGG